jgi:hypothetical protein
MATTVADLPELLKGFPPGTWVAISEEQNRTLAHGDDLQTVFDQAQQLGEKQPLIVRVPDQKLPISLQKSDNRQIA